MGTNGVIAVRQIVVDGYMFKQINTDSISEVELKESLKLLPNEKFYYYNAKQKMSSKELQKHLKENTDDAFELSVSGLKFVKEKK